MVKSGATCGNVVDIHHESGANEHKSGPKGRNQFHHCRRGRQDLSGKEERDMSEMKNEPMLEADDALNDFSEFTGTFKHSIDSKGRIFIPAKYRELLGTAFVIAKDIRLHCLRIYTVADWKNYLAKINELDGPSQARYRRFFGPNALPQKADPQGRATLSKDLMRYANIGGDLSKDAVIIGCITNAEIWNPDDYERYVEEEMEALLSDADSEASKVLW